ncbi:MAG: WYL domain-containing protein [Acidimicrobiales bacterium]|nr:WYL domain-containing protein [Acidimicrobiales bacterium]
MQTKDTSSRLNGLLAILEWLDATGSATVGAIAKKFNLTPTQVVKELELASCYGIPPFSPDALLDIWIDYGQDEPPKSGEKLSRAVVHATLGREFASDKSLSPEDILAIGLISSTYESLPDSIHSDVLKSAVTKLLSKVSPDLGIEIDRPNLISELFAFVESNSVLIIDYFSANKDALRRIEVWPLKVMMRQGNWYLDAVLAGSSELRRFRLDRIRSLEGVDETFDPTKIEPDVFKAINDSLAFKAGPESLNVTIEIPGSKKWMTEAIPVIQLQELPNGNIQIVIQVVGTVWLKKFLLKVGPGVKVIAPEAYVQLPQESASEMRKLYAASP